MPTYEYRCTCGKSREIVRLFSEKRPNWLRCACGKRMTRTYSMPQVFYRGPGFTKGGYDYELEAATGRNFEEERERAEYEKNKDDLDVELDKMGLNPFEDTLPISRSPVPDAV